MEIDLSNCGLVGDTGIIELSRRCRFLQKLQLKKASRISDLSIVELAKNLIDLRSIDLSGCVKITDLSLQALGEYHKNHLRHIDVSNCPNVSQDAVRMAAANCSELNFLYFKIASQN